MSVIYFFLTMIAYLTFTAYVVLWVGLGLMVALIVGGIAFVVAKCSKKDEGDEHPDKG